MKSPVYDSYCRRAICGATFIHVRLIGLLVIMASVLHAQTDRTNRGEGFDKPLKKTVVDLGPSPFYMPAQHVRNKLTCYYYATFTVKEYDQGEKGAEWLSLVPSSQAACVLRHRQDEKVYTEWSGYFRGAKGALVFFDAADGIDGGLPFAVFDVKTGRELFQDSYLLDYYQKVLHIKNTFRVSSESDQIPHLAYFRVVHARCDLKAKQSDCWKKVRTEFGIVQTEIPVCSGYEQAEGRLESTVVYPVSVLLTDAPQIKPVQGPVFCWPPD